MNIPDKAVEAAARAEWAKYLERTPERQEPHDWESLEPNERCDVREYILPILEAAAPFIAAQALRDYADVVADGRMGFRDSEARGLRDRAKWLEAGA